MENLAYQLPQSSHKDASDYCPACGQQLFGPDADASSWRAWGAFYEIIGMSNVELLCGDCGEHLPQFCCERKTGRS